MPLVDLRVFYFYVNNLDFQELGILSVSEREEIMGIVVGAEGFGERFGSMVIS